MVGMVIWMAPRPMSMSTSRNVGCIDQMTRRMRMYHQRMMGSRARMPRWPVRPPLPLLLSFPFLERLFLVHTRPAIPISLMKPERSLVTNYSGRVTGVQWSWNGTCVGTPAYLAVGWIWVGMPGLKFCTAEGLSVSGFVFCATKGFLAFERVEFVHGDTG